MTDEFTSLPYRSSRTNRQPVPTPLKYDLYDIDDSDMFNIQSKKHKRIGRNTNKSEKRTKQYADNRFAGELPPDYIPPPSSQQLQYIASVNINEQTKQADQQLSSMFSTAHTSTDDDSNDPTNHNHTNDNNNDILQQNTSNNNIPPAVLQAIQSQSYGKSTQSVIAWQPSTLLCKRFNVPVPIVTAQLSTNNNNNTDELDTQFVIGETIQPDVKLSVTSSSQATINNKPTPFSIIDIESFDDTVPSQSKSIDYISVSDSDDTIDLTNIDDNTQCININTSYPHATAFLQSLHASTDTTTQQSSVTQPATVNELSLALELELERIKRLRYKTKSHKHKKHKRHKH